MLIKKYRAKIIVFSEPKREEMLTEIKEFDEKSFIFPKGLTLTQFAALMKKCRLLICNDGGPLQIAVGVGTPTVSIHGPVSEVVYGPYPPRDTHQIVKKSLSCQPCYRKFSFSPCEHRRCLEELSEEEVLAKVEKVLGQNAHCH